MKNSIVVFKDNLNGLAAASCFYSYYKKDYEYKRNTELGPDFFNKDVYLINFCYSRDVLEHICAYSASVTIIHNQLDLLDELWDLEFKKNLSLHVYKDHVVSIAFNYIKRKEKHKNKLPVALSRYIKEAVSLEQYLKKINI